jgi:hypothetical protein
MVIIVKLAIAPSLDWTVITGFFLALLNYNSKKVLAAHKAVKSTAQLNLETEQALKAAELESKALAESTIAPITEKLTQLEDKVRGLGNMFSMKR